MMDGAYTFYSHVSADGYLFWSTALSDVEHQERGLQREIVDGIDIRFPALFHLMHFKSSHAGTLLHTLGRYIAFDKIIQVSAAEP